MPKKHLGLDRTIDLKALSKEQLAALAIHMQQRCSVVIASTNTLTAKLQETGELGPRCHKTLGEFSAFLNDAIAASDKEISALVGSTPDPKSVN
ncbi:hypothetical protein [Methyloceanibacter sp.]|uniref:hypothetical protein n=1 Tax=Methyloceanibacter sp. TaxID=1965321 RepID=UPI002C94CDA6|nr:hypothetical protein [Methyloceanibacter sp.]HML92215.1 hypothetical protein [Methyloceanibacter sp.]